MNATIDTTYIIIVPPLIDGQATLFYKPLLKKTGFEILGGTFKGITSNAAKKIWERYCNA